MRVLAMSFQIYLTQRIGSEGIGLYELLMSVYGFAVSLAVSGVRLSTTRLTLEICANQKINRGQVVRLCLTYSLLLGISAGGLLYLFSNPAAALWLDAAELASALRVLAFGLPFLSLSSCLNGYFAARRQAGRMAVIQISEFAVHTTLTFGALFLFAPQTPVQACFLLVCTGLVSDLASAAFSAITYHLQREPSGRIPIVLLPDLLHIAVPDAIGSWVRSGLVSAKHLLIPKGLKECGTSSAAALSTYGVIHGMVLPLLTFPAAFLGTISGLLVPEIAESHVHGNRKRVRAIMQRTLHLTLMFSLFAAMCMFCYGGELGKRFYRTAEAETYLRLLAPLIPLMYIDMVVDGMLKGLGLQTFSMRINILDAALSLLLVWQLIPKMGICGYLITIYLSELLNFSLSLHQLRRHAELHLPVYRSFFAPLLSALCAVLLPRLMWSSFCTSKPLAAMAYSTALYWVLLRLMGCITKRDIQWFFGIFRKN